MQQRHRRAGGQAVIGSASTTVTLAKSPDARMRAGTPILPPLL